jgi:NADPH-dependent 2,4-dienoyl-CoA reductase/sulfur reductase-like enzyme
VFAATPGGILHAETPQEILQVRWRKLVLATGARELFLPFPGWTLPHVMGAGALQAMVKAGWPVAGRQVVVAGSGPLLLAVAASLRAHGARVEVVAEQSSLKALLRFAWVLTRLAPSKLLEAASYAVRLLGAKYRTGCWPVSAQGAERLESVTLTNGARTWTQACDLLACSFGLVPNLELARLLGCQVEHDAVAVNRRQATSVRDVYCAGEPTGAGGLARALVEGQIAGLVVAGQQADAERLFAARARAQRLASALREAFVVRPELRQLAQPETVICRCEDVVRRQLDACSSWREAKLATRCGMGPCQGRVCGGATHLLYGWDEDSVRPPALPVRVAALTDWTESNAGPA